MPTYDHICENLECAYEWEDRYGMTEDPPKICPKCNQETAKRLISAAAHGKVELYGQDLKDKVQSDAHKMMRESRHNEKLLENLLGPDKFSGALDNKRKTGHW